MRRPGSLLVLLICLPVCAQNRLLDGLSPQEGLAGTVRFAALVEGERRGSFEQTVSYDSAGLQVREVLSLRYGPDSTSIRTDIVLDRQLRLLRQQRKEGTRLTVWRRLANGFVRETSIPSVSDVQDLSEFDLPETDVVYGFGHFLLLLRCVPLEDLDGHHLIKLERAGAVTVYVQRLAGEGPVTVEYREVYGQRPDGDDEQRMLIELDEAGVPQRITSPELVFEFRRLEP